MRLHTRMLLIAALGVVLGNDALATPFCEPKEPLPGTGPGEGELNCTQNFIFSDRGATPIHRNLSLLSADAPLVDPQRALLELDVCGLKEVLPNGNTATAYVTFAEIGFGVLMQDLEGNSHTEGRVLQLTVAKSPGYDDYALVLDWYRTETPLWSIYEAASLPPHDLPQIIGPLNPQCDERSLTPIYISTDPNYGVGVGLDSERDVVWHNQPAMGAVVGTEFPPLVAMTPYRIRAGMLGAHLAVAGPKLRLAWGGVE